MPCGICVSVEGGEGDVGRVVGLHRRAHRLGGRVAPVIYQFDTRADAEAFYDSLHIPLPFLVVPEWPLPPL